MLISFAKKHISLFCLLFINFLLVFIWFKKGLMFGGSEEGLPYYDLQKFNGFISSVWYEVGTGYPLTILLPRIPYVTFIAYLNRFGISVLVIQALTFLLITSTPSVSVYLLIKKTTEKFLKNGISEKVALISGIFYLFNPYSLTQVFGRALYAQMFGFALLPLFLFLVIKGIKEHKFIYALIGTLANFAFAPAYVMVTEVVVVWTPVFIYFLFHILTNRNKKEIFFTFKFAILIMVSWVIVHAWWLIPTLKVGGQVFAVSVNNLAENVATLRGVSAHFPLPFVLRLMQNFYFFDAKAYGDVYSTFLFLAISWLIPIIAIFSVAYIKKIKDLWFFALLFLVGLFVSLGSNPPLGKIFVWFFIRLTPLQAFRNPYEKFGLVFLLAYVPFFALGVLKISQKIIPRKSGLVSAALVLIVSGMFVWPMWNGSFGGAHAWTLVPNYYKEADNWLNSQKGDFKIIQMPLISNDGVLYSWQYPYQGIEPGEFLFTRSSIGRNVVVNKVYYNVLLERFDNLYPNSFGPDPDISKSEFRSANLYEELAKLNVRYIVFHNDLEDVYIGSKTKKDFINFLLKEKNIRQVNTFGKLDIYEVNIPSNIAEIYSPSANISYKKLSPDNYEVTVTNSKTPLEIYFLQLFDPNWILEIDGEQVGKHGTVFSYANKWVIDRSGDYKILIKYKPQESVDYGKNVSKYSVVVLIAIIGLLYYLPRRKNIPSN